MVGADHFLSNGNGSQKASVRLLKIPLSQQTRHGSCTFSMETGRRQSTREQQRQSRVRTSNVPNRSVAALPLGTMHCVGRTKVPRRSKHALSPVCAGTTAWGDGQHCSRKRAFQLWRPATGEERLPTWQGKNLHLSLEHPRQVVNSDCDSRVVRPQGRLPHLNRSPTEWLRLIDFSLRGKKRRRKFPWRWVFGVLEERNVVLTEIGP